MDLRKDKFDVKRAIENLKISTLRLKERKTGTFHRLKP
jgi:hypothetical protein